MGRYQSAHGIVEVFDDRDGLTMPDALKSKHCKNMICLRFVNLNGSKWIARYICYLNSPPTEYCGDITDVVQSQSRPLEEIFSAGTSRKNNNGIYLLFKKKAYFNLLRLKHDSTNHSQQHLSASYGLSHVLYVGMYNEGFVERMKIYEKGMNGKTRVTQNGHTRFNPAFDKAMEDDLMCITRRFGDAFTSVELTEIETAIMCMGVMFAKWKDERLYNVSFSNAATRDTFCNDMNARQKAFAIFNHVLLSANEGCIFPKRASCDVRVDLKYLSKSNFSDLAKAEGMKPNLQLDWFPHECALEIVKKIKRITL